MQNPTVSFVVPCYKLAHLLPECINSILFQSYSDFEVLIMDDCSPDNTPEVARSFNDPRVKYIRNYQNLGSLRNYNKGISLSRGRYVWLISADDYLHRPYVLERYVELMEQHPNLGLAFCPAVAIKDNQEAELLNYSVYCKHDQIVKGHTLLKRLLHQNFIVAPSAMARRECYEKVSFFPLEFGMEWSGDWYLWCAFALSYDAAFFAEPMVCYRVHQLSMTNTFTQQGNASVLSSGDIAVPLMIKKKAAELGFQNISQECLAALADQYAQNIISKTYRWLDEVSTSTFSIAQFEESLCRNLESHIERSWVRARTFLAVGDRLYAQGDLPGAKSFYWRSLQEDCWGMKAYAKLLFVLFGGPGEYMRKGLSSLYKSVFE